MGERRTDVEWELASDERFRRVVRRGVEITGPEVGRRSWWKTAGPA
jgi:alkaline phosphatase D